MIKKALITTIAFNAALCTVSSSVHAQQLCGPRQAVVDRLSNQYGETRRSMGLGTNNGVVEVYASDQTGTWTITITLPDGRTCLMAAGESYEDSVDPLRKTGTKI